MLVTTYAGNGTIKNIPITDTGTACIVPKANNSAYSYGRSYCSKVTIALMASYMI